MYFISYIYAFIVHYHRIIIIFILLSAAKNKKALGEFNTPQGQMVNLRCHLDCRAMFATSLRNAITFLP